MGFTRSDLKDLDKIWGDSTSTGPEPGEVPEGRYQARLKSVELGKSSSGRPQCMFVWRIVGGDKEVMGKEITTYDGLETAQNMGFFRRKLRRFGLGEPDSFSDIPELLEEAVGAVVEIQVKYKDDFVNVYVNKLVQSTEEAGEDEDDEPKRKKKGKKGKKAVEEEEPEEEEEEDEEDEDEDEEDEDEEDEEDEDDEEEEEDEEDEEEEEEERQLPTQDEVDEMKPKAVAKLLSKEFKVKLAKSVKAGVAKGVAKTLVAIMEDDDYTAPKPVLEATAKALKLKPKKSKKATLREIIKKLGG